MNFENQYKLIMSAAAVILKSGAATMLWKEPSSPEQGAPAIFISQDSSCVGGSNHDHLPYRSCMRPQEVHNNHYHRHHHRGSNLNIAEESDSPSKKKKDRKRERSVDGVVEPELKRVRGDRGSNCTVTDQDDVQEVEKEEKKRPSRRKKEI